jgi:uncharacterized membrane protein
VHLGWLKLDGPLTLIGSLPSVVIFTLLAVVELVADKLPQTPSRTAPPGLIARILMGGLTGACVAAGGGQGSCSWRSTRYRRRDCGLFRRYQARTGLVKALGTRDIYVALVEDLVTIAGCVWVVTRF